MSPVARLLHLPDHSAIAMPLTSEIDIRMAEPSPAAYRRMKPCGICEDTETFRFYSYASVEWKDLRGKDGVLLPFDKRPDPFQVRTFSCDCRTQWFIHRQLCASGIQSSYQTMSEMDIEDHQALKIFTDRMANLDDWLSDGYGMVLSGPHGNGKSSVAAMLCKAAMARGKRVHYMTFSRLLDTYARGWTEDDVKRWITRHIRNADLLVIDDLGQEVKSGPQRGSTRMAVAFLDDIMRYRVSARLATIITTNEPIARVEAMYGSSVLSLIFEGAETIVMSGPDFRKGELEVGNGPAEDQGRVHRRVVHERKANITRPMLL